MWDPKAGDGCILSGQRIASATNCAEYLECSDAFYYLRTSGEGYIYYKPFKNFRPEMRDRVKFWHFEWATIWLFLYAKFVKLIECYQ